MKIESGESNNATEVGRQLPLWRHWYHLLWALLGALIYGREDKRLYVIGVTGTKGKSTTLEILNAILEEAGKKTALLSSIRVKIGDHSEKNKTGNSMPGRLALRTFIARANAAKCNYALIEVTSQGVIASRHRFIAWNAGVLTNIAPEHIEAHGTFERYRAAKFGFLKYVLERGGNVFVNGDDAASQFFVEHLHSSFAETYSARAPGMSDLFASVQPQRRLIEKPEERDFLSSDFNRMNAAAAVAVAREIGIPERFIETALKTFGGVPGRVEFVQREPFSVVVDYAHTPESLRAVYSFLRSKLEENPHPDIPNPKLICVLGAAGGGRDKWKRPEMGKVADAYCDEIILTDEDPYDEPPDRILFEIQSGISKKKPRVVLDRTEAIRTAIHLAHEGDMVIATGKGSEEYIHIAKGKKIPWNDRVVVEEVLKELKTHENR